MYSKWMTLPTYFILKIYLRGRCNDMDNKFSSNLIAFVLGMVVFSTDLFTRFPSLDRFEIAFVGGYVVLSLYHTWKFAYPRISNLSSILVFWLFPIIFLFTIVFSLLIGHIISVPKFVISFIKWLHARRKPQTYHEIRNSGTVQKHQQGSNIISLNFKSS